MTKTKAQKEYSRTVKAELKKRHTQHRLNMLNFKAKDSRKNVSDAAKRKLKKFAMTGTF